MYNIQYETQGTVHVHVGKAAVHTVKMDGSNQLHTYMYMYVYMCTVSQKIAKNKEPVPQKKTKKVNEDYHHEQS